MKDLLNKLLKAVADLAETPADGGETPEVEAVEMSMEDFVGYVTDQVQKAAADSPEVRAERLVALTAQIEVAKNFQGPTPGKISIKSFKDPAQITPTTAPAKTTNAPQTTNFTAGAETAPAGKPSTPAGGSLPPTTAGGFGFSTPAAATFAKSMEEIKAGIEALASGDATSEETSTETTETATTSEETSTKPVTKAADPLWPIDMNTPFGRGEADDDNVPLWGFDPNSDAAARNAAETATKTPAE